MKEVFYSVLVIWYRNGEMSSRDEYHYKNIDKAKEYLEIVLQGYRNKGYIVKEDNDTTILKLFEANLYENTNKLYNESSYFIGLREQVMEV